MVEKAGETIWGYMVKKESAQGGCLGSKRRRKTWQPAKSTGELATSVDPVVSEWGNLVREIFNNLVEESEVHWVLLNNNFV